MKRLFNALIVAALAAAPLTFATDCLAKDVTPEASPAKQTEQSTQRGRHRGELFSVLTEEQKPQVEKLIAESRERSKPLFEKLQAFSESHKQEAKLDDKSKVEFESLVEQLRSERKATSEKIIGILTPEQKAKLEASRKNAQ